MPCAVRETTAVTPIASTRTHHPTPPPDAILEQLSASIAEINQPISAVVMNAEAVLRLLGGQPTDTEAVRQLLAGVVKDGLHTGDIVNRTRALIDRKRADERLRGSEQRLLDVQMELAHGASITALAEMTAFIFHEVNQPLAGRGLSTLA